MKIRSCLSLKILLWISLLLMNASLNANPHQTGYIITGGPGYGKTCVINYLESLGECVVHEAATDLILAEKITDPSTYPDFQKKLVRLQIERERAARKLDVERVFYDRGLLDNPPYWKLFSIPVERELHDAVEIAISVGYYNQTVFFLEDLGKDAYVQDEIRHEDHKTALKLGREIEAYYKQCGYNVVRIPKASIEERAHLILDYVNRQK